MKKINIILMLMMVFASTSVIASATDTCQAVDPFYLLTQLDDGCYNVNATGYYEINAALPVAVLQSIPANIPTSLNVVVNSTVHKSGNIVTLTSFTSNPSLPAPLPPVAVDVTDLQFVNDINTWIATGEIGFSANIVYGGNTIPVIGVMGYERYENGLFIFSFKEITINAPSAPITITNQFIEGEVEVRISQFDCESNTLIPEFPTIAIPIAAIIGLAFIMQRRKD